MASASCGRSVIEFLDKVVEAGLLLQAVHFQAVGLLLSSSVRCMRLVAAVLLRVARLDALDGDAEAEPPHR